MDKETLSNYGWIVILVLVLAVMLALASPFGNFVATALKSTTQGLFDVNQNALDIAGIVLPDQELTIPNVDNGNGDVGGAEEFDWSKVNPILAENDWQTIQKVIQAGKVTDVGWKVGDLSPKFEINGKSDMQAVLVDINSNNATFMLKNAIGYEEMNHENSGEYGEGKSSGGYASSAMSTFLEDVYQNKLDANLKSVIATSTIACAGGPDNPHTVSNFNCNLFLPSVIEMNQHELLFMWGSYPYETEVRGEGTPFDFFAKGGEIEDDEGIWMRTPSCKTGEGYFFNSLYGGNDVGCAYENLAVCPAFVIG